jgi:hypothetical protein
LNNSTQHASPTSFSSFQVVDDKTGAVRPAGAAGSSVVLLMVRDAYANYVVQTTLDVVPESEEKRLLLEELNAHADELVGLLSRWCIPTESVLTPVFRQSFSSATTRLPNI